VYTTDAAHACIVRTRRWRRVEQVTDVNVWQLVTMMVLVPAVIIAGTISVVAVASLIPSPALRRHVRAMLPLLTKALGIAARKPGEQVPQRVAELVAASHRSGQQQANLGAGDEPREPGLPGARRT
jgi:hypothetical protein